MHYTIHDENGKTTTMVQMTKPGHYAMQKTGNDGKTGEFIVDSAAGTTTVVSSEDKSYFVITKEMMQGMAGMMSGMASMLHRHGADSSAAANGPKPTITRNGTAVVAGITCDVYHYDGLNDNKHVTGDVCLAKGVGMGLFSNPMGSMMGGMGMQQQQRQGLSDRLRQMGQLGDLFTQGYGILKASNNEDGKPKGSIEVTAIERGMPPDAAFAPPAGYKEKSMGGMMGGPRH
jgi:hypothetical protein